MADDVAVAGELADLAPALRVVVELPQPRVPFFALDRRQQRALRVDVGGDDRQRPFERQQRRLVVRAPDDRAAGRAVIGAFAAGGQQARFASRRAGRVCAEAATG